MTAHPIIQGAQEAALWAKATKGGAELPTEADRAFLGCLSSHTATLSSKATGGHQVRARCKHLGWAVHQNAFWNAGWLLTNLGRVVLETRVHLAPAPQPAAVPDEGGER